VCLKPYFCRKTAILKKILLTGSNGLLGQKIVDLAVAHYPEDIELLATSNGANRNNQTEGYTYQTLDITDFDACREVITRFKPDCIINTAAMTNVDLCETERIACWKLNVDAVLNMAKICEEQQIHFIQLSTDFVFDGEAGPYDELAEPNPLSYYGESKLAAEEEIQFCKTKWAIIRTIIIYGIVDNMSRSNVVLWAKDALAKGQPINVVDDQFRSPTLAEDLAQACINAALKGATGIYNVSGKETMSILELVNRVADFFKLDKSVVKPIKSDTLNQAAKRPPRTGFIIDKAVKELDYLPHTFEEGLKILAAQLLLKA
jgi:dTDP-4-dehydrorhamnose reductase